MSRCNQSLCIYENITLEQLPCNTHVPPSLFQCPIFKPPLPQPLDGTEEEPPAIASAEAFSGGPNSQRDAAMANATAIAQLHAAILQQAREQAAAELEVCCWASVFASHSGALEWWRFGWEHVRVSICW